MNAMSGGGVVAPGTPTIVSVVGPSNVDEGSEATITVTTQNFPDGDTTLNWTISQNAGDFVVSSGTVVIKAGPISTVFEEVSGAIVDISKETGDDVYTYDFSGTLSGSGLGFGYPVLSGERIGSTSYFRGSSTGVFDQYRVLRQVIVGGDGIDTFTVTPELDNVVEGDETFTVTVSGTVDGTPVTRTSAPITINDINNATSIPAGVFTGRPGTTSPLVLTAKARNEASSTDGETVTAISRLATSITRSIFGAQVTPGFSIRVQTIDDPGSDGTYNQGNTVWWTPSGGVNPLTGTAVELYRNANVTPTAVRIRYRLAGTTTWTNLGWQSVSGAGEGEFAFFSRTATAGAGGDDFSSGNIEVEYSGRADGFLDTVLATFVLRLEAYAEGANF